MRTIIGAVFLSLDGVMQAPGGPEEDSSGGFGLGGWIWVHSDDITREMVRGYLLGPPYELLLGRRTYDIFAAYWPQVPPDNPIAARFNPTAKWVLSSRDLSPPWYNSQRLSSLEAVRELKASNGPDLLVQGSSTLYPQLLAAGLLDRLILQTFPVVLGRGKRLFGEGTPPGSYKLVSSVVSSTGVVMTTYEFTGQKPVVSFIS
ncbi:dihydrofolate reductase family protein [Meiothermus sp. CFH 77666]|uniref:dihydrofolate reductase family protein n=1 Tax=Meiothermus sp. CFH 77666 TaxID=2817942 RepID=UPI001AA01360|nr:dihydrofolate reductase family protein [Meiothermus sp. CFH 77666]MBO1436107.1 dihydrofolate reductase [Meiothermus sp. CFH 77666]